MSSRANARDLTIVRLAIAEVPRRRAARDDVNLRARMRFVVGFLQPFHCYVRIDLRSGQTGMPEQGLDASQIGTPIKQMGSETMAQLMGTDRDRDGSVTQITPQR